MTSVDHEHGPPSETVRVYSGAMRAFHWASAVVLIGVYLLAWSIGDAANAGEAARLTMLHRSLGLIVLILTLARALVRWRSVTPPLPADLPAMQRLAARCSVVVLYLLLVAQPLLGLVASMLHGDRILVLGSVLLPNLLPVDRPFARFLFRTHGWCAIALLTVIGVHVAAALYHHLIRRDAVLAGMVPGLRPWSRRRSVDVTKASY